MSTINGSDVSSPPPISARIWKIAAVTGAGAFMAMLDSTVANLAIESIRDNLNSTLTIIQWVATGYLIALAVSLPTTAWLGARYGYGRIWSISLTIFTISSALCAIAPGSLSLISARFLQGLAAGVMIPTGQAILGSVAGSKQLGRIMGSIGLVVALGPAVGPAFGGFLLEVTSWRSLFWINVPLGIITLITARGLIPIEKTENNRPLDWRGLMLIGPGLPLLLYGATEIGLNNTSFVSFLAAGTGILLTLSFIYSSIHTENPLIDLTLLQRKNFSAAASTTGLTGANMYGGLLLLPLYLQLTAGQNILETGFMLLAMGLGTAVALYFGGMLTDYYSAGPVTILGSILLVVTTVPFLFITHFSIAMLIVILVVRGVGIALAQMPAYTAAYTSVTDKQMGDAATLVNITQRVGGAVGAVGLVIMLTQFGGINSSAAYRWAFSALTIISVLTIITGILLQKYEKQNAVNRSS